MYSSASPVSGLVDLVGSSLYRVCYDPPPMNTPVREGETIEGSRTTRNRPYPVLKCSRSRRESFCGVGVRNNGTGWLFSLSPLLALSMSCARCPTPFAQQHLKLLGPPNSGRSVAEWAPSLKRATDACVLASNNASPAQRGPRRDAQPLHATPLAAVLFPAPLRARAFFFLQTDKITSNSLSL